MNPIFIVLPILALLMYDLGLVLQLDDFKRIARHPRAVLVGEVGQIVVLPLLAFLLAWAFRLEPIFFVGMVLVACCPGGSSSNVFSMLAKGDVALSVTLTALSSIVTLATVPLVLALAVAWSGWDMESSIHLPIGNLLVQNLVLMFLPILLGVATRRFYPKAAGRIERALSRSAFPALMFLAAIFFMQHYENILNNIGRLGLCMGMLILLAMGLAALMSRMSRLPEQQNRTIIIEVGMQNAAQAIAIAASPFVFANEEMAIPAIIYALLMNIILLVYVAVVKKQG